MSEPLQFGNDLTPRELPLPSSRRGTAAAVTGQIQSGTDETPVEAAPNCSQQTTTNASTLSGHPPKVGVASIQVGVVSPGNQTMTSTAMTTSEEEFPRLRMASSVGGEGSEGGGDGGEVEGGGEKSEQGSSSPRREVEEAEEEEEDSVMQLRIEDSVMELEDGDDGEMQFSRSHDGRQLGVGVVSRSGEGDEDLVMETGAHSNSIGTSPPPPPSQVGVRVHRQAGVGISDGRSTRGEEPNGVKYPKPQHYRPMGFHGNANSHLMKGSVATVSPSLLRDDRGGMDERVVFGGGRVLIGEREKGGVVSSTGDNGDILPSYRVRKVAKVKQFFTTLQRFGDRQSSEVAEQVQELIAALVNGTATIEEFHQEIQTVTNHPLRQFIIPFLRENLDLFREALRDSEQALSDVLFHPPSSSSSASIAMTPQFIDEDLPVLPSSKPPLTPTLSSHTPHSSSSSSSLPLTAEPAAHASFIHHSATNATTNIHRSVHSQTHPLHPVTTMNFDPAPDTDSAQNSPIPRKRTTTDRASMQSDIHSTIITDKTLKRPRQDINHAQPSVAVNTVTMPSIRCGPVPSSGAGSYPPVLTPHQQHTSHSPHEVSLSHPPHTPTLIGGHTPSQGFHPLPSRKQLLAEDWSYIDMMLNSVVGMVEKGRNAMAILRERALNSNSDLERREQEQQKIAEATEKARRHWQEQKIHLQREAARKLKETVAQVRGEMEQKMAQAQSMAVQEALKEANAQSNSKEVVHAYVRTP
ncbi:Protein CBFA2T2 [Geodia barretti]|uniref:Protein CBFA2T2 n=1 Tax=Geodia barretti TaxID=519541 RepID=A0AA35SN53_GEOBA|nr:Protein CBFA2T2 [Geodia barretti]